MDEDFKRLLKRWQAEIQSGHVVLPPGRRKVAVSGKKLTAKGGNDARPLPRQPVGDGYTIGPIDGRGVEKTVTIGPPLPRTGLTYYQPAATRCSFKAIDRVIAMVRARAKQAIAARVLGYKPVLMLPALGQTSQMCHSYYSLKVR